MIVMHDMEMDEEEREDYCGPCKPDNGPLYPWGLRICLTEKELAKLGLDPSDAKVGGVIHGHFMAKITSLSINDTANGTTSRVETQIEMLAIESEDAENEDA